MSNHQQALARYVNMLPTIKSDIAIALANREYPEIQDALVGCVVGGTETTVYYQDGDIIATVVVTPEAIVTEYDAVREN